MIVNYYPLGTMNFNSAIAVALFVIVAVPSVTSQKCSLVTKDDVVRCENLSNLTVLENSVKRNWNNVVVTNRATATLTLSPPVDPSKFSAITSLDLSKCGKLVIQTPFSTLFPAVTTLNLTNTKITAIDGQWFSDTNRLRNLDLGRNRIVSLARNQFKNMTRLQVLHLSNTDITAINATIFTDLKRLRELQLNSNRLSKVQLGPLASLQFLWMTNNLIGSVTNESFRGMEALEELHLEGNRIQMLQARAFADLPYLRLLNLTGNQLQRIRPRSFLGLETTDLQVLDLSRNGMTSIEANGLVELRQLLNLNLSSNSLHNSLTANTFLGLRYLRTLDLSNNDIDVIGDNTFKPLLKLESLDLSLNHIEVFKGSVFGTAGQQLKHLILTRNNLLEIDAGSFDNLDSLAFLYLDYNALHHLPEQLFSNNFELRHLMMNDNALEEVSWSEAADMNQLEYLFLHRNRLTYFSLPRASYPK